MKFTVVGSGSSGNSYFLTTSTGEILIIELGVNWKKIKEAISFDLRNVIGALVSHSHQDHCKGVADALKDGIDIYVGERADICADHRRVHEIGSNPVFVGDFMVAAFPLKHDVPVSGFHITHPECGQIIFITDTCYTEYTFPGTNHFIVEANYSQQIIDSRVASGSINAFLRKRVMNSHMELQTTISMLRANDLSQVKNIVLIHLSEGNSHAADFKKNVQAATGKPVYIADPGLSVNLSLQPF